MRYSSSTLSTALSGAIRRFRRNDEASLSVEAVLVIPILIWAFVATFTFFDVFRAKSLSLKANYAISDLLSREVGTLDDDYLVGAEKVFQFLTQSDTSSWVRVTPIYCVEDCAENYRVLARDWSKATDGLATFSNDDIMEHFEPLVPWIAEGERVILVETGVKYTPPFSKSLTGIGERDFIDIVMTRPRFAGHLCWEDEEPCY